MIDDSEVQRIQQIYAQRDMGSGDRYAWYQPDVIQQQLDRNRILAKLLKSPMNYNLREIDILDLGCGTGEFLRLLVEWGALPQHLTGVELLKDRLQIAEQKSPSSIHWHYGQLDTLKPEKQYDLVSAFTVFSSVLEQSIRQQLADSLWRRLKPGGWLMILDFRYNNPKNNQVRAVTRQELAQFWPRALKQEYQSLYLAPPLARKVARFPLLYELLTTCCPICRSHFIYLAQKAA